MKVESSEDSARTYDRAFLLSLEKHNQLMASWEVERYGMDSFADAQYVRLYGMPPREWYQRGIRLLARTTVECVRDALGELIGRDVEQIVRRTTAEPKCVVIDPFAGSCNSLYWLLRHIRDARGIAFELDPTIFEMTKHTVAVLDTPIELVHGDYRSLLPVYRFPDSHRLVVFVAPPWGKALNERTGLNVSQTTPPIPEVIDDFETAYSTTPILYVSQVHQFIEPISLANLHRRFDWSELRIYNINSEGKKHGVLLGGRRWQRYYPLLNLLLEQWMDQDQIRFLQLLPGIAVKGSFDFRN